MKTVGISAAGGVGRATAELIVSGSSSYDMYELDISRFLGLHNNRKFLRDRVREVPGKDRLFLCKFKSGDAVGVSVVCDYCVLIRSAPCSCINSHM